MPPYTLRQFLADQLRAAAPGAEWGAAGVDRADEMAAVLIRNGITDLSRLRLLPAKWTRADWSTGAPVMETVDGFAFEFNGRRLGYLGDADGKDAGAIPVFQDGNLVSWSSAGHGNVSYRVIATSRGFAIVPIWGSSSDAGSIRNDLKMIGAVALTFALPAAGVNLGASIGAAVLPASVAAAYPALAAAVGNAAIGAAFNGGNIEAAAKMAALGALGAAAGAQAGAVALSATDVEMVGKLADAATRAVVSGRDIESAVKTALIQNAGLLVPDAAPPPMALLPIPEIQIEERPAMSYDEFGTPIPDTWEMAPLQIPDVVYESAPVNFDLTPISIDPGALQPLAFPLLPVAPEFAPLADVKIEPPITTPQGDPFTLADTRNLINTVSAAALAAISIVKAAKGLNPSTGVNTTARAIDPRTGAAIVALDNGLIQSRNPDGTITLKKSPTGQPQSTASGNVIINNGDGTYTLIDPQGRTRVIQYESGVGGFDLADIPIPAILGGVALLTFLIRR